MRSTHERVSAGHPIARGRRARAVGRRTAVLATATVLLLIAAACGGGPAAPPAPSSSSAGPTAPASGLKTIDKAALQAVVDETAEQLMVPGYLVLLRAPQGEFVAASGTTKLGTDSLPTADTHFRIASITKTMTSAATLLLAQEGKLSLDDPVTKYIPDVPNGDNITIAQLLEMRSGLYSFTDSTAITTSLDDDPTKVWKPQQLLDIAFAQPPNFAPGAEYEYSNTNYVLLGLIVEKLEGQPIATVDLSDTGAGASSQQVADLDDRVDALEADVKTRATKNQVSQLSDDVKALSDKVAKQSDSAASSDSGGTDEQARSSIDKLEQSVQTLSQDVKDLDGRVQDLEDQTQQQQP